MSRTAPRNAPRTAPRNAPRAAPARVRLRSLDPGLHVVGAARVVFVDHEATVPAEVADALEPHFPALGVERA